MFWPYGFHSLFFMLAGNAMHLKEKENTSFMTLV